MRRAREETTTEREDMIIARPRERGKNGGGKGWEGEMKEAKVRLEDQWEKH